MNGGSHAFAAPADGKNGEKYVLKIDMPEDLGGDFACGMAALRTADGNGYVKLYEYDPEQKVCLLERLGKAELALGNTAWFEEFIGETYEKLNRPCPSEVIERAYAYLKSRAADENAGEFVTSTGTHTTAMFSKHWAEPVSN